MTVGRLLEEISSQELTEWQAFYNLEPFGEERADLRSAIVASTVANVNRNRKSKPVPLEAFLPRFEQETEDDRNARLMAKMEMVNALIGGTDMRFHS